MTDWVLFAEFFS